MAALPPRAVLLSPASGSSLCSCRHEHGGRGGGRGGGDEAVEWGGVKVILLAVQRHAPPVRFPVDGIMSSQSVESVEFQPVFAMFLD